MSNIPIGSIHLYDAVQPALDTGLYRVTSGLNIVNQFKIPPFVEGQRPLESPLARVTYVNISGPRFSLGPEEIADCYPPIRSSGAFGERLPHIVLGRRTLPWERKAVDGIPWLALLVFRASEASLVSGKLNSLLPASVIHALKAQQPIEGNPAVTVLRVNDLATFQAVLPRQEEVKLLAHVRQVNLKDTALAGRDDDGWFAVVVANRLPLLTADEKDTPYLACLVSLEARNDIWNVPTGQSPPALVVLFSWTFTITQQGGTFEHIARSLNIAPFGVLPQDIPAVLAEDGTLPLEQVDRQGNRQVVRYRGPLLGLASEEPDGQGTDHISTRSAFEIGRLLAIADGRFIREIVAWHRAIEEDASHPSISAPTLLRALNPAHVATPADAASYAQTLKETDISAALMRPVIVAADRPANLWRVHPAVHALLDDAPRPPDEKTDDEGGSGL